MEIDLNPIAGIKIRALTTENIVWKGISLFLFIAFVIIVIIFAVTVFYDGKSTKNEIKKIRKQQEKQGALLEKVYKEKEQDQKKISTQIQNMITKEVVEQMIKYMKKNRDISITEKCKKIGISAQGYYKAYKKYNLDGRIGARKSVFDAEKALKIMADDDEDSDNSGYNSSQDDSE